MKKFTIESLAWFFVFWGYLFPILYHFFFIRSLFVFKGQTRSVLLEKLGQVTLILAIFILKENNFFLGILLTVYFLLILIVSLRNCKSELLLNKLLGFTGIQFCSMMIIAFVLLIKNNFKSFIFLLVLLFGVEISYSSTFSKGDLDSGLSYLRNRYYDAETGSFLTKDPLGIVGGTNSYVYVSNNPVNLIDPLGLFGVDIKYISGASESINDGDLDAKNFIDKINGLDKSSILELTFRDHGDVNSIGLGNGALLIDEFTKRVVIDTGGTGIGRSFPEISGVPATERVDFGTLIQDKLAFGAKVNLYGCNTANPNNIQSSLFSWNNTIRGGDGSGINISNTLSSSLPGVEVTGFRGFGFNTTSLNLAIPTLGVIDKKIDLGGQSVLGITNSYTSFGSLSNFSDINSISKLGGVLIDKAATLIGSNLSDIKGATYDPISKQLIFLGSNDPESVKDIDLDYFYTAVNAVYGSAVPPFVTLDPPVSLYTQWSDYGDGDGTFEPGEWGGVYIRYNPIWSGEDGTIDLKFIRRFAQTPQRENAVQYGNKLESRGQASGNGGEKGFRKNADSIPFLTTDEHRFTRIKFGNSILSFSFFLILCLLSVFCLSRRSRDGGGWLRRLLGSLFESAPIGVIGGLMNLETFDYDVFGMVRGV